MSDRIKILYSDSDIIVINKPGGLLAVPGRGADKQECVVSQVKEQFVGCIAQPSVHRLDMATSGIMVLARTVEAHRNLSRQFAERQVEKRYVAILDGLVTAEHGIVELAFRLDPTNRPYQVYDALHGKLGITRWKKIADEGGQSRIEFYPETGRTHQLRLHSAHELGLNCPIVGDSLYGSGIMGERMMLHAQLLVFVHPESKEKMRFASPVPF